MDEVIELGRFTAADRSGRPIMLVEFVERTEGRDGRKFVETDDGKKCIRVDEQWFYLVERNEPLRRSL